VRFFYDRRQIRPRSVSMNNLENARYSIGTALNISLCVSSWGFVGHVRMAAQENQSRRAVIRRTTCDAYRAKA
jgi:hypothetical protein